VSAPTLKERIRSELTAAMKSGDRLKVGTLRMLTTAIVNREKEVLHELSDDEVRDVAAREVKRRSESIEAFERGDRPDLVAKETAERDLLAPYAPERLRRRSRRPVEEAIATTGATTSELGRSWAP
jgi:uncharacterized protein YqeY